MTNLEAIKSMLDVAGIEYEVREYPGYETHFLVIVPGGPSGGYYAQFGFYKDGQLEDIGGYSDL